ncbi:MAG TPA: hypothetical protein PK961_17835, partial [bacterium]|nr:hypothetical protein [bacterium]
MEAKQLHYVPMLIPLLIFLLLGGASSSLADDDLPACGDYTEPVLWFEIDEFGETITGFEEVYTNANELAECTASVDGNIVLIDCGEWETSLTWLRTQQPLPFEDDQPVLAWAHVYDHDATSGHLFLLDENEDVILMHSNTGIPDEENTPFFIDGEMDLTSQDVCEYKA